MCVAPSGSPKGSCRPGHWGETEKPPRPAPQGAALRGGEKGRWTAEQGARQGRLRGRGRAGPWPHSTPRWDRGMQTGEGGCGGHPSYRKLATPTAAPRPPPPGPPPSPAAPALPLPHRLPRVPARLQVVPELRRPGTPPSPKTEDPGPPSPLTPPPGGQTGQGAMLSGRLTGAQRGVGRAEPVKGWAGRRAGQPLCRVCPQVGAGGVPVVAGGRGRVVSR